MEDQADQQPQLVDLREFVGILRRRKWTVIITALLVTGVALGLVAIRTPVYTSKSQVEVRPLTMNSDPNAIYYIQQSMNTEAERVTSGAI